MALKLPEGQSDSVNTNNGKYSLCDNGLCKVYIVFTSRSFLSSLANAMAFTALSLASENRAWNPRNASNSDFLGFSSSKSQNCSRCQSEMEKDYKIALAKLKA